MSVSKKIGVFIVLLVAVLGLSVLFASGKLRFGLEGPFVYIIYVFAGLLTSVLTFGLLSSQGDVDTDKNGYRISLGGAIVAFVVVVGCGGYYERYLHTPSQFDALFLFYSDNPQNPENVEGVFHLITGTEDHSVTLEGHGQALVRRLSSRYLGSPYILTLDSLNFEIVSNSPPTLSAETTMLVKVAWKQKWQDPTNALLEFRYEGGTAMNFGPRPDVLNVNLKFQAISSSPLPIPIKTKVAVELLSADAVPLKKLEFVTTQNLICAPRSMCEFNLDGFPLKDDYQKMLSGCKLAAIFEYDSDYKTPAKTFVTEPFSITDGNWYGSE